MVILLLALEFIGFVIPVAAAFIAYRQLYRKIPHPDPQAQSTYDDVQRWMHHDLPELFRERHAALKKPAIFAAFGLLCSTLAGVLPLLRDC